MACCDKRCGVCFPESGADPTIESDSGFNAMDMAVAMGHRNGMCKSNTLVCIYSTQMRFKAFSLFSSTGDGSTFTEITDGRQRVK